MKTLHKTQTTIPNYLEAALRRQGLAVLTQVKKLVDQLIQESEAASSSQRVLKVVRKRKVTFQFEHRYCGKHCKGCPHGPYWYAYYRKEGRLVSQYIGKERDESKVKL